MAKQATKSVPKTAYDRGHALYIEDFIPFRITRLASTLTRAGSEIYSREFGISITELRVLAILGRYGMVSANEISQRTRIDKGWVSRSVAKLRRQNYIERRPDPWDNRRYLLHLTSAGDALYRKLRQAAKDRQDWFLRSLTARERAQLEKLIDKMQAQADHMLDANLLTPGKD